MGNSGDEHGPPSLDSVRDDPAAQFAAQVQRPVMRVRAMFVLGLAATIAAVVGGGVAAFRPDSRPAAQVSVAPGCTALEVNVAIQARTMTRVNRAVCLAVAGDLAHARGELQVMSEPDRWEATDQLYDRARSLAERGHDLAERILTQGTAVSVHASDAFAPPEVRLRSALAACAVQVC